MISNVLKIVLNVIVSAVFLIIMTVLLAWVGGAVFGTTKAADGQNYGDYNSAVLLAIVFALTIVFAIWFYKFLAKKGHKAIKNVQQ